MPTNPALASEILKLADDEKSSASDFATAIRTDPVLSSRLLKTANSAQFAQHKTVTTIERATTVLGLNRVKSTALGFQLVMHLDQLGGVPFDMKLFWQHSLLRACLARSIAQEAVPERMEEAFLIGLLQDCGVLVLIQILGTGYANVCRSNLSPLAFYAIERESFPHTHVDAITVMASEWKLPPIIALPLENHHQAVRLAAESTETDRLSAVAYFVGALTLLSNLRFTSDDNQVRDYGADVLGLDEPAWARVQEQAKEEYEHVSTMFASVLPENVDVADLLCAANSQLAKAAGESDRHVIDVEVECAALEREQKRLQNCLREYRERAAVDPLTNVLNRGAITKAVSNAIVQNRDRRVSIGVLFLDLDNFKNVNDTHGHDVGDKVLKAVAMVLEDEMQRRGPVGRYGGEEFVALLCGLSAEDTRQVGDRIVERIRGLDYVSLGLPDPITCSLGAVWADRVPFKSAEELFGAADQLMYQAKRGGKNRSCFELLKPHPSDGEAPPTVADVATETASAVSTGTNQDQSTRLEHLCTLARQINENDDDVFVCIRKQERKKIVAPCTIHYFRASGLELGSEIAVTRNLATGGAGLLVDRAMVRGEPVEVVLDRGSSKLFIAGLLSFCRHVEGGIHEIGVQFVSHSVAPIISGDVAGALMRHDWVQRALEARPNHVPEHDLSVQ